MVHIFHYGASVAVCCSAPLLVSGWPSFINCWISSSFLSYVSKVICIILSSILKFEIPCASSPISVATCSISFTSNLFITQYTCSDYLNRVILPLVLPRSGRRYSQSSILESDCAWMASSSMCCIIILIFGLVLVL